MKTIYLLLVLNLFGIRCVGQTTDTLCLTAKEYNDLLVASNCTEIIKADSVLLWDKQHEIDLQTQFIYGQEKIISISETQLKKSKRQIIKYKFGLIGVAILGISSNIYLIFK